MPGVMVLPCRPLVASRGVMAHAWRHQGALTGRPAAVRRAGIPGPP